MTNTQSTVTELIIGFKDIIDAQVLWASLENPKKYHMAQMVDKTSGETLGYCVRENDE